MTPRRLPPGRPATARTGLAVLAILHAAACLM